MHDNNGASCCAHTEYAAIFAQTRGTDAAGGSILLPAASTRAIRDLPEAMPARKQQGGAQAAASGAAEPIDAGALFADDDALGDL
jgi:hypothetical protein